MTTLAHRIAAAIRNIRDEDGDTIPEVFGERFLMRVAETAAGVVSAECGDVRDTDP